MQNMSHSMTDGLLVFFNSYKVACAKKVRALAAEKKWEADCEKIQGTHKTTAAVCFIIYEMVSRRELRAVSG